MTFDLMLEENEFFASQAAERGATVIAFTDEWFSGVAQVARHVLMARVAPRPCTTRLLAVK
jgi:DNA-binding MurR/RpiR family transcriptional regulator